MATSVATPVRVGGGTFELVREDENDGTARYRGASGGGEILGNVVHSVFAGTVDLYGGATGTFRALGTDLVDLD